MDINDYSNMPLFQECQQKVDRAKLQMNKTILLQNFRFNIPANLTNTLAQSQITSPISINKLKRFIQQPAKEQQDTDNFWSPTQLEKEILQYYIKICEQEALLNKINQTHNNLLTSNRIRQLFGLSEDCQPWIYYVNQSDDILPNDCVFIQFPALTEVELKDIVHKINSKIDFQCNSILHLGQIEIYGVMLHILKRLESIPPQKA